MLGYAILSAVFVLCVVILTMLHMRQVSSLQAAAERRVDSLLDEHKALTANLVARNDREFQFLYGKAPEMTVVQESATYDDNEDYTEMVMDLREDAQLLGLVDEPVGP